jgi:Cu/Ag efflux pump CusA
MTISSLFIRRPRLAFVVSTVITIAGLLAITALPVAQFPDIVPPQVRVTATYPGASAQAVEESVAQVQLPILPPNIPEQVGNTWLARENVLNSENLAQ